MSEFKDSALGDSVASNAVKALSVASHSSFLSSNEGEDKGRLRVPGLPHNAGWGESFSCPYCAKDVMLKNRVDWK